DIQLRGSQRTNHLGGMHGMKPLDGLQFQHQPVIHDEVEAVDVERSVAVADRVLLFALEPDAARLELQCDSPLINDLKQSRTECPMNVNARSDCFPDKNFQFVFER